MHPLLASLLLGLAPFAPQPHIVGKLRWVAGGAVGMQPMDWFDLALHGAPWVWLVVTLVSVGLGRLRKGAPGSDAQRTRAAATTARGTSGEARR